MNMWPDLNEEIRSELQVKCCVTHKWVIIYDIYKDFCCSQELL